MAEEPLQYTQYDTDPPLEGDLEEQDPDTLVWTPMSLQGKTVRLLAQNRRTKRRFGGAVIKVTVPPVEGVLTPARVRYVLQALDLSDAGSYIYQWEITAPDGTRRTVPAGDAWLEFEVAVKLGAAIVP